MSIIVALSGMLQQCHSLPVPNNLQPTDQTLIPQLIQDIEEEYPRAFIAVHRALLNAAGKNFELNGYVMVRPESLKLICALDFGGTLFELEKIGRGRLSIIKNPGRMRDAWLQGAMRDAVGIYTVTPSPNAVLFRRDDGFYELIQVANDGVREIFLFDPDHHLLSFTRERARRRLYRIEFSSEGVFPHWDRVAPHEIDIKDDLLNYELNILVLDIRPLGCRQKGKEEKSMYAR